MRSRLALIATVIGLFAATAAQAGHHLWAFTEMYSNAAGTTQFVEMFCPSSGEALLTGFPISSGTHTYNFANDLPGGTANTFLLLATSDLAGLPGGVTPDYIIPANFFPTGGGTLNYSSGINVWNYGAVPSDGVHSLLRNGSTAVNSPTNFAGAAGSINQAAAVPMVGSWGLVLLIGALLLVASGLLRRREASAA